MFPRTYFIFALLLSAYTIHAQVAPAVTGGMSVPPPLTRDAYSTEFGTEARANYMKAAFTFLTAYEDNVLPGLGSQPESDEIYTLLPSISFDRTTPRFHQAMTYRPSFTIYQHISSRNEADHDLTASGTYRLSPYLDITVDDNFRKTSNIFNQINGPTTPQSPQFPLLPVTAPIAGQITNTANVLLSYQYRRNDMVGVSGTSSILHYQDPTQVPGLSNSNSRGGGGFWSHRLTAGQYVGASYQYLLSTGDYLNTVGDAQFPAHSDTRTHNIFGFYSFDLNSHMSFSLSGGPQRYEVSQAPLPAYSAWAPSGGASINLRAMRATLSVGYSHMVGGGGGLIGAYGSDNADGNFAYRLTPMWTIMGAADYSTTRNVSKVLAAIDPGGHMVSGRIDVTRQIGPRIIFECGYQRLHQSYRAIQVIANNPDANREYFSISYQFSRPIGQ